MTTRDPQFDRTPDPLPSATSEPAIGSPASPWSFESNWFADDLDHLMVVDQQLVWLSRPLGGGSAVWRLPLSDIGRAGRAPPRVLASFSTERDDRGISEPERTDGESCPTEHVMQQLLANEAWIYFDHPEGFARVPLTGGTIEVIARIAPNDPRRVTSVAWIDGALWLAGWLEADDASDPYDPYEPDDQRRFRAFVARIEHGRASTLWEVPTRRWPCVQLSANRHGHGRRDRQGMGQRPTFPRARYRAAA